MRRARPAAALAAVVAIAIPVGAAIGGQTMKSFVGADPDIEAADGRYWIYPTGGGPPPALYVWSSNDLKSWQQGSPLLRMAEIGWIDDDGAPRHSLWAPDMVRVKSGYYLYYSVGPQNPTPSRIGVARCKGPAGPCWDSGRPFVTGGNGFEAIDPAVFTDLKTGKVYLYAGGSAGATLRVWMLKPDMVTIDHEVKVAQPPYFTEGVFMHERAGVYYLSYSSGYFKDATYQVHYATAPTPTGPWHYQGKILESDDRYKGPGHHAFLRDPKDGRWYIAYHRWEGEAGNGPYSGQRRTVVQPIAYDSRGRIEPIRMK